MLEKNKDYLEFTLQTMMATHRPYQDGTDVSMTGMANGYGMSWAGGLDIPCDVVVISKRAFDLLQAKEEACQDYRNTIEDLKKKLEKWQTMTRSETPENAAKWLERFEETDKRCDKLAREIQEWEEATGYPNPSSAKTAIEAGANGNLAQAVLSWQDITGFSTPEKCSSYIDRLEKKLEDIKDLIEED